MHQTCYRIWLTAMKSLVTEAGFHRAFAIIQPLISICYNLFLNHLDLEFCHFVLF